MYRLAGVLATASLVACAGRAPAPVAVVQPTDNSLTCSAMTAEVASNNGKIGELGGEKGAKVAQNVAAGVVGLVVWPVWFLMDFQGAAGTEIKALQDRNSYLATKVNEEGCGAPTVTAKGNSPTAPVGQASSNAAQAYVIPAAVPTYVPASVPVYSAPTSPRPLYTPQSPVQGYAPAAYAPANPPQVDAPPVAARSFAPPAVGAYDPYLANPAPTPISTRPPAAAVSDPYAIDP
jgi:hypothetical protein